MLVEAMRDNQPLSMRDKIFGVLAAFSALYCVAVSFVLSQAEASQKFLIGLAIFVFCFYFVKQKRPTALGIAGFVALRLVWGLVVTLLHSGKF